MAREFGYDSHNHPLYFGMFSKALDLTGLGKKEALSQIREGRRNLVINWDNSKWELSSQEIEFDFPVAVINASFHGMVMNSAALTQYGLKPDSSGLVRDSDQMGKFIDQLAASYTKEDFKRLLLLMQEKYFQLGIDRVDDMGMRAPTLAPLWAIKELKENGQLKLELNLFFRPELLEKVVREAPDLLTLCAGVKIIYDGAFGVWTAALFAHYTDQPNNFGKTYMSYSELKDKIDFALQNDVEKITVHCIGNRAINDVLGAYDSFKREGVDVSGWRLEHALLIDFGQAHFAKKRGLILSMQPNFSSDVRYRDRLGDRVNDLNPFRMLIDECGFIPGTDLLFGSDGMPTGLTEGLKWATNPPLESQKLTMEEAQAAYQVKTAD